MENNNSEITNTQSRQTTVSSSYSLDEVRNIVLEMRNEATSGLRGEQRWDMQKRLGRIRNKWKLGY
jgi:hypothetical protein